MALRRVCCVSSDCLLKTHTISLPPGCRPESSRLGLVDVTRTLAFWSAIGQHGGAEAESSADGRGRCGGEPIGGEAAAGGHDGRGKGKGRIIWMRLSFCCKTLVTRFPRRKPNFSTFSSSPSTPSSLAPSPQGHGEAVRSPPSSTSV